MTFFCSFGGGGARDVRIKRREPEERKEKG